MKHEVNGAAGERQTQYTLTETLCKRQTSPSKSAPLVVSRSEKAGQYQNPS